MARIRTVKPEFFRHVKLYEAEKTYGLPLRMAFAGLWTAADREGRFRWEPRALKLDCLPYDECDFAKVLESLAAEGFIRQYEVDGEKFGCIPSWHQHQVINNREIASQLPEPRVIDACPTRAPRDTEDAKGKGREGKGREGALDADASHSENPDPQARYFNRVVEVLGPTGRSLGAKLLKAKSGVITQAESALVLASGKADPREYIGAIIRGGQGPPPQDGRSW